MADFRKWLFAFAVLALLLCVGTPAHAQGVIPTGFTCIANSGVPPFVRIEGVTELVGDVVIACTGGVPANDGEPIPPSNVQVLLNTQITSRILANGNSEATILIDEPYPGEAQVPAPPTIVAPGTSALNQFACAATNQTNCAMVGSGGGQGIHGPYNGSTVSPTGRTTNGYNVFQGIQVSANQVDWLGIPIDAPGTTGAQRVIRITNIRGNICNIASGASSFIPFPVYMFISINGTQQVTLSNPQVTVAFLAQGLKGANSTGAYQQCYNLNASFLQGSGGQTGTLYLSAIEGFASSFKVRTYDQIINPGDPDSAPSYQNVPGYPYNTESGYVASPTIGTGAGDFGLAAGDVGLADTGTEITFTISNVPAGVSLFAPVGTASLYPTASVVGFVPTGSPSGEAVLVNGSVGGQLSISGGTASVTYEVLASNVNVFEELVVPINVAYITTGPTSPAPNTTSPATVTINFGPAAGTNTTASAGPIPRFCTPYTAGNFFTINPCSCNLLFPFVTNQAGFDTGVAIVL